MHCLIRAILVPALMVAVLAASIVHGQDDGQPAGDPELPLFADRFEPAVELIISSDVTSAVHRQSSQTLTFTFDEAVVGFEESDIHLTGGLGNTFTAISASVYTLTVQGLGGRVTVEVAAGAANAAIAGTRTTPASLSNFYADSPTILLPGNVPMTLIRIPAGTFQMGSPVDELSRRDDETQHQVTLSRDFYMGRDEVTQAQWLAVMGTFPEAQAHGLDDNLAVHNVSHNDIMDPVNGFMRLLNDHLISTNQPFLVSLPTESQWEYAARAGTATRFSFGDGFAADELCTLGGGREDHIWYCGNAGGSTQPVGQKLANPWGLHDMHGNISEWGLDWKADYPAGPVIDPVGPETGATRVRRSGNWNNPARDTRSASRNSGMPDMRNIATGFRVAAGRPAVLNVTSNQGDVHQSSTQRLTFTLNGFQSFDVSNIVISGADLVDFRPLNPDNPFFWIMDLNNLGGQVTIEVPADAALPFPPFTTSTAATFSNFYQDTWTAQLRDLDGAPVTMDLIRIPPGTFMMGAPGNEQSSGVEEKPQFQNSVDQAFYMSTTEVTQDQFVSIRSIQPIPPFPAAQSFVGGTLPVHNVTLDDALFAADRLFDHLVVSGQIVIPGPGVPTVTLPSETQWEYAARAGTTTRFSFGNGSAADEQCALGGGREEHMWFCGNASGSLRGVGLKNPNPWGLYDMHGNALEWTTDNFTFYPLTNPPQSPLQDFTARGGSFGNQARRARSAARNAIAGTTRNSALGFRIIINPEIRTGSRAESNQ